MEDNNAGATTPDKTVHREVKLKFAILDSDLQDDAGLLTLVSACGGSCIPVSEFHEISSKNHKLHVDKSTRFILVTKDFTNPAVKAFRKKLTILGPLAFEQLVPFLRDDRLAKCPPRPAYNLCMKNVLCLFAGVRKKDEDALAHWVDLVHNMGGEVRQDFKGTSKNSHPTHIIAQDVQAEKYHTAVSMGIPVMSTDWVTGLWEMRDSPPDVNSEDVVKRYRLKPFAGLKLFLHGFPETEFEYVRTQVTEKSGEIVTNPEEALYVVLYDLDGGNWHVNAVDNPTAGGPPSVKISFHRDHEDLDKESNQIKPLCFLLRPEGAVLKNAWFHESVAIDSCANPTAFLYTDSGVLSSSQSAKKRKTPSSRRSPRRTSRPRLSAVEESSNSRRPNASFDFSDDSLSSPSPLSVPSQRKRVVQELHETEKNYVSMLDGILEIIDKCTSPAHEGGQILQALDLDQMNGFTEPVMKIREIHKTIFEQLDNLLAPWNEGCLVGEIFVKCGPEFEKVYPPFINSFPRFTAFIEECQASNPRFYAEMKLCEKQKEYGREHLKALLIRPVQRLGSVLLLLKELLKQTKRQEDHGKKEGVSLKSDIAHLENAVNEVERILKAVNEGKRAAEAQELLEGIDGIPDDILSSHVSCVDHLECTELGQGQFRSRGGQVLLVVLNDRMVVAKVRNLHTRATFTVGATEQKNRYKYVKTVTFSSIKQVIDVAESEEVKGALALKGDLADMHGSVVFKFSTYVEPARKREFLTKLAHQISIVTVGAAVADILRRMPAGDVGLKGTGTPKQFIKRAIAEKSRTALTSLGRVASFGKSSGKKAAVRMASMMSITSSSSKDSNMSIMNFEHDESSPAKTPTRIQ